MGQAKQYDVKYKEQAVKLAEEKGCKAAGEELGVPYGTLIINNSLTDTITACLPKQAEIYSLSADDLRSAQIRLNGKALGETDIGNMIPIKAEYTATLAAATCTFIVV